MIETGGKRTDEKKGGLKEKNALGTMFAVTSISVIFLLTYMYTYINWKVSYPEWWGFEMMGIIQFLMTLFAFSLGYLMNELCGRCSK